jgi:ATP-binding cassette, subfamily B, bacterial
MTPPRASEHLAAVRTLLAVAFRRERLHAALALAPIQPTCMALGIAALRPVIDQGSTSSSTPVGAIAIAIVAWSASLTLGRAGSLDRLRVGERLAQDLDARLIAAASSVPTVAHLDDPDHVDRLEVLRTHREAIVQAPRVAGWLVDGFVGTAIATTFLALADSGLLIVPLACVPLVLLGGTFQRQIDGVIRDDAEPSRRAAHLFDVASRPAFALEVRVAELGGELLQRYRSEWVVGDRARLRAELRVALVQLAGLAVAVTGFVTSVLLVARSTQRGDTTPGELFVALSMMSQIVGSMTSLASGLAGIRRTLDIAARFVQIERHARAQQRIEETKRGRVPPGPGARIGLSGVSFQYRETASHALEDVDVVLQAGSTVAIVGENGSGKSTLVKLLLGLLRPSVGTITIGDVPLDEVRTAAWHRCVAATFQDPERFEMLAREVVGMGDLALLDDDVALRRAITSACSTDVVSILPNGLDSQLGARFGGTALSPGQWQRLAVARAMVQEEPSVRVLDEPTSSLDPLTEAELLEACTSCPSRDHPSARPITILISHRLSSVCAADVIIVLDRGRVREHGSHEHLMRVGGAYAAMFEMQARDYR